MTDCQPFDSLLCFAASNGSSARVTIASPIFFCPAWNPGLWWEMAHEKQSAEYSKGGKGMIAIRENESLGQD